MNNISIKLFPNQIAQKPMRDILGMNGSPRITTKGVLNYEKPLFDALKLRHVRYHDSPLTNPGQDLIDVHCIFPLLHLDETDPRNYFFAQTDDYLRVMADSEAEIDFRLGESIDHSGNARRIGVPEDKDKWARVCRNIVGHYKNGEMDGMHLNITRVTVWEEPDNEKLFGGTVQDYAEMFCKVYKLLKKDFPDILVGGPSCQTGCSAYIKEFLTICKANGVTPDYVATTMYTKSLKFFMDTIQEYRDTMDECGCKDMRYALVEWHMSPTDWDHTYRVYENGFYTTTNAAFSVAALIGMMDIDYLDVAYYYNWDGRTYALLDQWTVTQKRQLPAYYGLMFFQKLATECTERVAFQMEETDGVYALAGKTADGKQRILIACYNSQPCTFTCETENAKKCTLYAVNEEYHEEEVTEGRVLCVENGSTIFEHEGEQGVYLLEFEN